MLNKQPYSAPMTHETYALANAAFLQYWTGDRPEVLAVVDEHITSVPSRILTIGSGKGEFEEMLIERLIERFGQLDLSVVAVEPNAEQIDGFQRRVERLSNVNFTYHHLLAEEFTIETSFDLILFIHSLYHMPDKEDELIRNAHAHLRPGGHVVITLATECGAIYQLIQRFWNQIDYSHLGHLFGQESCKSMLDELGISYFFCSYPEVGIEVTELSDDLLCFLFQINVYALPDGIRADMRAAVDDIAYERDGRRYVPHGSGVFVLRA